MSSTSLARRPTPDANLNSNVKTLNTILTRELNHQRRALSEGSEANLARRPTPDSDIKSNMKILHT